MTIPYVYDAGALIAVDNNDRRMWARHSIALEEGRNIYVPSIVVGQASRDSRRQVRLGKFLASCIVEPVGLEVAKAAGVLCGRARTGDVVDAVVVVLATQLRAVIWTSDPEDMRGLIAAQDVKPEPAVRQV